jgi:uncharacterized protein YggE
MNNTFLDNRVRTLVIIVLALLGLFLLIQSIAAAVAIDEKDGMMPTNVISVRGVGEVVGTPDIATFSFTIRENAKDVAAAQQAMTEKSNRAIDYLKEQGIDEKDMKTESYYTNPTYQYLINPSRQTISGYEVSRTVSVKVRDLAKAGNFLTEIAALQIGEVSGLSFTIDDIESLKADAKKQAIEKAKEDAEKTADALGVDLGEIVGFYEEYPYDRPYESAGYGGDMMSATKVQNAVAPALQPGETKVTATVSISYELED